MDSVGPLRRGVAGRRWWPPRPATPRRPAMRAGALALLMLGAILLAVLVGPLIWRVDPNALALTNKLAGPGLERPLGTDEFGRDILSRLLHGGRRSLAGALLVLVGSLGLGGLVGALAGMLGGRVDALLSRLVDACLALPTLVLAFALVGVLGKSFAHLLLALVLTHWPWYARVCRGLILRERVQLYVEAAGALGVSPLRIMGRHIGPNILGPLVVLATINLGGSILSLTALSFLGLGAQPPDAEWGAMINSARLYVQTAPWVVAAPGLAIGLTVIALNIVGDLLRDRLDPRLRARS